MSISSRACLICILLVWMSTGACIVSNGDSSLTIINRSNYALVEINLSPTGSRFWGRDLLDSTWLYPGERISIDYINCDYYDVRIVDDTYATCIIVGVDFCFSDDVWVISDAFLDDCIFGR